MIKSPRKFHNLGFLSLLSHDKHPSSLLDHKVYDQALRLDVIL